MRSSAPRRAWPATRPLGGRSPNAARKAWLFPAPDSPTTPRHSPGATASDRFRTACTSPAGVEKVTFRLSRWNAEAATGARSLVTGIQCIAQSVTHEVEAHEQHHQEP